MTTSIIKKALSAAITAVSLCGCDSTEPDTSGVTVPDGEARIEIAGGTPGVLSLKSRGVSEPSRPGYCNADMLRIWTYRGVRITTVTPTVNDMSYVSESVEIPVSHYSGENFCNKWTSHECDITAEGARNTGYAMPSLAYSAADKAMFTVTPGDRYTDLTLKLTGTMTPELYFGRVSAEAYNDKKENQVRNDAPDGIFYVHNLGLTHTYNDSPLTGKLYRIVSQLNVKITKVNGHGVKKMEMYLSNVPTELTLFGQHGVYYPVSASTGHTTSGDIAVSTAEDFSDGTATLSTFLLPSATGRSVKIRVYYASGDNDTSLTYKDYEIRPPKSFFLTGDDAEVYLAGAAAHLRHETGLYVYNGTDNVFYSYANVRVNISGDFDKVFAETTVTDVNIEVCPSFDNEHRFEIN